VRGYGTRVIRYRGYSRELIISDAPGSNTIGLNQRKLLRPREGVALDNITVSDLRTKYRISRIREVSRLLLYEDLSMNTGVTCLHGRMGCNSNVI
jgi:hypothetical protein